jgi:hypothetical protein
MQLRIHPLCTCSPAAGPVLVRLDLAPLERWLLESHDLMAMILFLDPNDNPVRLKHIAAPDGVLLAVRPRYGECVVEERIDAACQALSCDLAELARSESLPANDA